MHKIADLFRRGLALRQHLYRGGWASIEAIVGPGVLFLLSPWLLQELGSDEFAIWLLALAIAGFTNIVSLGAGTSTMYAVAACYARNEKQKASEEINAGFSLVMICLIFVLTLTYLLVSLNPVVGFFDKIGEHSVIRKALALGIFALMLQEIDTVFAGAIRGAGRYDLVSIFEIFTRPTWAVIIALSVSLKSDIIFLLTIHNLFVFFKCVFRGFLVKIVFKHHRFNCFSSWSKIHTVLSYGKWISVQSIGGFLFATADRFIVSWLFGSADLVRYSLCLQVVQFIHNLQAAAFQIITPWVIEKKEKYGQGQFFKINRLTINLGIIASIAPLILAFFAYDILNFWLGEVFAMANSNLLEVLLIGGAILAFSIPMHYIVLGFGQVQFGASLLIVAGFISILTATLLSFAGLMGFAAGRMMYGTIACLYFIPIYKSSIGSRAL